MYFVSIDAGAQVAIILLACEPCVIIVNCWNRFCTLGRAPHTNETLPNFREWCRGYPTSTSIPRVDELSTRHPVFRALQVGIRALVGTISIEELVSELGCDVWV